MEKSDSWLTLMDQNNEADPLKEPHVEVAVRHISWEHEGILADAVLSACRYPGADSAL